MKNATFILLIIFISSCNKIKRCPECFTPPSSFAFRIINKLDSTDLISSGFYKKDSIHIYYQENSTTKEFQLEFQFDSITQKTRIITNEIAWKSASGIKNYYIELTRNEIDTLYLDVIQHNSNCCTSFKYNEFRYNMINSEFNLQEQNYIVRK